MLRITILLLLAKLGESVVDPDLQEKYETMPRKEFIEYFNKQNYPFKVTDYPDDVKRVSAADTPPFDIHDYAVKSHDPLMFENLPESFDARKKWPQCKTISEIYDQGDCGSCWAFGTVNTASDRTCIHKNIHVHLAEQDVECLYVDVCKGGLPIKSFLYWMDSGLVSQECKPYNITELKENICDWQCVTKDLDYYKNKHYGEQVYQLIGCNITQIKTELFLYGPIQASFNTYADFHDYKGGVYEHKYGNRTGSHSVRVIGYGVENATTYWLVANSWSDKWGEHGYFRVKAYAEDLNFENVLISGMPRN